MTSSTVFPFHSSRTAENPERGRVLWPTVEKRADVELEIRQVLKLGSRNDDVVHLVGQPRAFTAGSKFTNECEGVIVVDPERNDGAAIAEDSRHHLVGKLRQGLCADGQRQGVFSRFAENGGVDTVSEVLDFVGEEVVRLSLRFRDVLARQSSQGKFRHDEQPEKGADIFTESTFRQVAEDDLCCPSPIENRNSSTSGR